MVALTDSHGARQAKASQLRNLPLIEHDPKGLGPFSTTCELICHWKGVGVAAQAQEAVLCEGAGLERVKIHAFVAFAFSLLLVPNVMVPSSRRGHCDVAPRICSTSQHCETIDAMACLITAFP